MSFFVAIHLVFLLCSYVLDQNELKKETKMMLGMHDEKREWCGQSLKWNILRKRIYFKEGKRSLRAFIWLNWLIFVLIRDSFNCCWSSNSIVSIHFEPFEHHSKPIPYTKCVDCYVCVVVLIDCILWSSFQSVLVLFNWVWWWSWWKVLVAHELSAILL